MGRQLNFWMTANDELDFLGRLHDEDVCGRPMRSHLANLPFLMRSRIGPRRMRVNVYA